VLLMVVLSMVQSECPNSTYRISDMIAGRFVPVNDKFLEVGS